MILSLDFSSDTPIYQQIRNQIVIGISNGMLVEGEKLPTTRGLAEEIGINTMTVNKAYQILKQEGYINTDRRKGAVVNCMGNGELPISAKESLIMAASEARISGLSKEEFLELCKKVYEGGSVC